MDCVKFNHSCRSTSHTREEYIYYEVKDCIIHVGEEYVYYNLELETIVRLTTTWISPNWSRLCFTELHKPQVANKPKYAQMSIN